MDIKSQKLDLYKLELYYSVSLCDITLECKLKKVLSEISSID